MLAIAISGVKWIVRFQLVLIVILAVAMLDFLIGTLAQEKPGIVQATIMVTLFMNPKCYYLS